MHAPSPDPGRVVVVTGASSGIGREVALRLAGSGTTLVLAARSVDALNEVADRIRCAGGRALVVPTDIRDAAAVESLFASAMGAFGRVHVVVHCAAVLAYGRFADVPEQVWDGVIDTTLIGSANVARSALGRFRDAGDRGALVVVGSVVGKIAVPWMSSYVAAKWALHALVRTLQIEARATPGIEVSLVTPGSVDTPTYRNAAAYGDRRGSPPPPVVDVETVAAAVVGCIDRPRRDRAVGLVNPLLVLGFRVLPGLYDRLVIPLMSRNGLQHNDSEDTTGNVLAPSAEDAA